MTWKPDKLDELFADEKAVSPVVGVALLIAMTVILAAVIATVVLGLGAGAAEAPQASFSFEDDGNDVEIIHDGGDVLDGEEVDIRVNGASQNYNQDWSAGQSATVTASDSDRITVVWEDSESDKSATLAEYTVSR